MPFRPIKNYKTQSKQIEDNEEKVIAFNTGRNGAAFYTIVVLIILSGFSMISY
jgi:hypothetical protein